MSQAKFRGSRFGSFATAAVLFVAFPLVTIQGRSGGPAANAAAAKATFSAKCAMCHGADGAGSEIGKSMNVPNLRSAEVQKLPDSQLEDVIANGKNGMPSFKGSLNAGQIHDVVAYIRSFAAKK